MNRWFAAVLLFAFFLVTVCATGEHKVSGEHKAHSSSIFHAHFHHELVDQLFVIVHIGCEYTNVIGGFALLFSVALALCNMTICLCNMFFGFKLPMLGMKGEATFNRVRLQVRVVSRGLAF